MNYNSGDSIRAFLEERGLGARKMWGQHFLVSPHARQALVAALDLKEGDAVWEIGPGLGAMTSLLLDAGAQVAAFEIDPGFSVLLREIFAGRPFRLIEGDVLKTWEGEAAADFLLGNLPYSIAGALVGDFIEKRRFFSRMAITVQKEVAARFTARPGGKDYSSLSALVQAAYAVKPLLRLKAAAFYPPPKVDSQALLLEKKAAPDIPPLYPNIVRALFSARRKTVANNLNSFGISAIILDECGVNPKERAENLGVAEFAALARAAEKYEKHSG
jgi:16S rRNA (adenine1518-N6/adenine1519-N6)-dimethyltransferase